MAAYEVEHATSISCGIVVILDLTLGAEVQCLGGLFLVAPDVRKGEVRPQVVPAFSQVLWRCTTISIGS